MADYATDIITKFPTLEADVVTLLEAGKFKELEISLADLFRSFNAEQKAGVAWANLVKGSPFLRGDIDEVTWQKSVLQAVFGAVLQTFNGRELSVLVSELANQYELMPRLQLVLRAAIPGATASAKAAWLKNQDGTLFVYLVSNIASDAGVFLYESPSKLPAEKYASHLQNMDIKLRHLVFSYDVAKFVYESGKKYGLSDAKIAAAARVLQSVYWGFLHPENMSSALQQSLAMDAVNLELFLNELKKKYIEPYLSTIFEVTDPLPDILQLLAPKELLPADCEPSVFSVTAPKPKKERVITFAKPDMGNDSDVVHAVPITTGNVAVPALSPSDDISALFKASVPSPKPADAAPVAAGDAVPMMIFQEKDKIAPVQKKSSVFSAFSLSRLLSRTTASPEKEAVIARIDVGKSAPPDKEEPKVVNYSDTRRAGLPYERPDDVMQFTFVGDKPKQTGSSSDAASGKS